MENPICIVNAASTPYFFSGHAVSSCIPSKKQPRRIQVTNYKTDRNRGNKKQVVINQESSFGIGSGLPWEEVEVDGICL